MTKPAAPKLAVPAWLALLAGTAVLMLRVRAGAHEGSLPAWLAIGAAGLVLALLGEPARSSRREPLFSAGDLLAIGAAVLFMLAYIGHDIDSWRYSWIGDEYTFKSIADDILAGQSLPPFWLTGAYYFPMLGSYLQAGLMSLLGPSNWSWRMSSLLMILAATPFFFLFLRILLGRGVAACALCFWAFCPTLGAFGRIGYNNSQVYLPVLGGMALAAASQRTSRSWLCFAAGWLAGLGVYTVFSALLAVPFSLALLIVMEPGDARMRLRRVVPAIARFGLGAFLAAAPVLSQLDIYLHNAGALSAAGSELAQLPGKSLEALLSFARFPARRHFLFGSMYLPLGALFGSLGLAAASWRWRNPARAFLLATYLICAIAAGGFTPGDEPRATRLMLMAPWVHAFAAIGFYSACSALRLVQRGRFSAAICGLVLMLWFGASRYRSRLENGYVFPPYAHVVRRGLESPEEYRLLLGPWREEVRGYLMAQYGLAGRIAQRLPGQGAAIPAPPYSEAIIEGGSGNPRFVASAMRELSAAFEVLSCDPSEAGGKLVVCRLRVAPSAQSR